MDPPTQRPPAQVTETERFRQTLLWIGIPVILLLAVNAVFMGMLVFGSGAKTDRMIDLSESMNASTTRSMTKLWTLIEAVEPATVDEIADNTLKLSRDLASIVGSVASNVNMTALAGGVGRVMNSLDTNSISYTTHRIHGLFAVLEPVKIARILEDIRSVAHNTQEMVAGLVERHYIKLEL